MLAWVKGDFSYCSVIPEFLSRSGFSNDPASYAQTHRTTDDAKMKNQETTYALGSALQNQHKHS